MAIRLMYGYPGVGMMYPVPAHQYIALFRVRLILQSRRKGLVLSTYRSNNGGGGQVRLRWDA